MPVYFDFFTNCHTKIIRNNMLLSIILIPFITALILLFIKDAKKANTIALVTNAATLAVSIWIAMKGAPDFNQAWIPALNSQFLLHSDGLAKILVLLTAISFPVILMSSASNQIAQKNK